MICKWQKTKFISTNLKKRTDRLKIMEEMSLPTMMSSMATKR